jgi:mRNA-degrading endonuclease RelE of RelBE toxin-antitoxin system
MYEIEYTPRAIEDIKWFKKHEQNQIVDGIDMQLQYEPTIETRNRKRMRPNSVAAWELRIGDFRVLYDVDDHVYVVEIQRVGEKRGSAFFFRGRKEELG